MVDQGFSQKQLDQLRGIVREEVRAEVGSQLESRLPAHLAPIQEDVRAIREAYVDDVTILASEQLTLKRVVQRHSRRLTTLEARR